MFIWNPPNFFKGEDKKNMFSLEFFFFVIPAIKTYKMVRPKSGRSIMKLSICKNVVIILLNLPIFFYIFSYNLLISKIKAKKFLSYRRNGICIVACGVFWEAKISHRTSYGVKKRQKFLKIAVHQVTLSKLTINSAQMAIPKIES